MKTTNPKTMLTRVLALGCAGALTLAATASGVAAQGRPAMTPPSFAELDADGSGAITRSDLEAFANARFADADTDGDGILSEAELLARAAERAEARNAARVQRMLNRMDVDGDGALSRDELRSHRGERGDMPRGRMLKRADTDGDGAVSEAEYDAALARMADHRGRHGGRMGGHRHDSRRGG